MTNLESNSYKSKERQEKDKKKEDILTPIDEESIIVKEKNSGTKLIESILGNNVDKFVQDLLEDIEMTMRRSIADGISSILVPGEKRGGGYYIDDEGYYVRDYKQSSSNKRRSKTEKKKQETYRSDRIDGIEFTTREKAEEVLHKLRRLTYSDMYGFASVADFNRLTHRTGAFTDYKWGWTDLEDATVRMTRNGYIIDFPPVKSVHE